MGRVLRRFGNRGTDIKRMRERGREREAIVWLVDVVIEWVRLNKFP